MYFGSSAPETRREVEKVIEDLYVRPFVEEIQNCKQFKSGRLTTSEELRQFFNQRYNSLGDSELGKFAEEYLRKNQVLTLAPADISLSIYCLLFKLIKKIYIVFCKVLLYLFRSINNTEIILNPYLLKAVKLSNIKNSLFRRHFGN